MPFRILSSIFDKARQKDILNDSFNTFRSQQIWAYDRFNSPSAQSAAMRRAGLNPIGAVKPNVVGGSMPSVPPSSPLDLSGIARNVADVENINADTELKREQTRGEWFDNIIKERDANARDAIINAELERLRQEAKKSGAEGDEARLRVAMLEEFIANGGNVYEDNHQEVLSRIAKNAADISMVESNKLLNEALVNLHNAKTAESRQAAAKIANERLLMKINKALLEQDLEHRKVMYPLEEDIERFAKEITEDEAEISELNRRIKAAWVSPDTWSEAGTILLDFLKNNVSLFGGRTSSETSYGVSRR